MTIIDLIRDALIIGRVIRLGEEPNTAQVAFYTRRLKAAFNQWSEKGILVPGNKRVEFNIPNQGKRHVTIGLSDDADVNIEAPILIKQIDFIYVRDNNYQYGHRLSQVGMDNIPTNDYYYLPRSYYYERNHPIATLYFDSSSSSTGTLKMVYEGYLSDNEFMPNAELDLPRLYNELIIYSLAITACGTNLNLVGRSTKNEVENKFREIEMDVLKNRDTHYREKIDSEVVARSGSYGNSFFSHGNRFSSGE